VADTLSGETHFFLCLPMNREMQAPVPPVQLSRKQMPDASDPVAVIWACLQDIEDLSPEQRPNVGVALHPSVRPSAHATFEPCLGARIACRLGLYQRRPEFGSAPTASTMDVNSYRQAFFWIHSVEFEEGKHATAYYDRHI
jgi:hypothetical protein